MDQELEKRKALHKRIFASCMDCDKETSKWNEEKIENATCPDCSTGLIELNKEWRKRSKKRVKFYKCGKTKKMGYRKNCHEVYCVDCAKEYWKWRSRHFWFCADDCLQ